MDFSTILAAHREKALARIAAKSQGVSPVKQISEVLPATQTQVLDRYSRPLPIRIKTSPPANLPSQSTTKINAKQLKTEVVRSESTQQNDFAQKLTQPENPFGAPLSSLRITKSQKLDTSKSHAASNVSTAAELPNSVQGSASGLESKLALASDSTSPRKVIQEMAESVQKYQEDNTTTAGHELLQPARTKVALNSMQPKVVAAMKIQDDSDDNRQGRTKLEYTNAAIKWTVKNVKETGPVSDVGALQNTSLVSLPTVGQVFSAEPYESKKLGEIANTSEETDVETLKLLSYVSLETMSRSAHVSSSITEAQLRDYQTAPIFSYAAQAALQSQRTDSSSNVGTFSQHGLLGVYESTGSEDFGQCSSYTPSRASKERLIFANLEHPFSAFICGSQGSGKSHLLSCLLENGLAKSDLNQLPNPLSGIVFHYDRFSGKSSTQLCEAAYLCSTGIPVTVLVSPSNIWNMQDMYNNLPGLSAESPRPKVLPLYLSDQNITISTMMKLMCADTKGSNVPLYISVVHSILQEMAMEGHATSRFSYTDFKRRIDNYNWLLGQKGPLEMRLKLLESFLEPSEFTRTTRPASAKEDIWAFEKGSLTVVDLSDSFVDENDACALFSICLSMFMESRHKAGQIIALDEAHKFLTQSGEAKALTEDLTSIIRLQRHTGTRVFIATQEPTLSPKLMDLANVTIVHRFLSPDWYNTIRQHLAGANKYDGTAHNTLFETIVALETGEALLFCPTALLTIRESGSKTAVERLGNDYARVRIRKRQTADGGRSVIASDAMVNKTAIPVTPATDVPMFIVTRPPDPPRYGMNQSYRPFGQTYGSRVSSPSPHPAPHALLAPLAQTTPSSRTQVQANIESGRCVERPSSVAEMQRAVRGFIRTAYYSWGWDSPDGVSWERLYKNAEDMLGHTRRSISDSEYHRSVCNAAARMQINECRKEQGLKEIPIP